MLLLMEIWSEKLKQVFITKTRYPQLYVVVIDVVTIFVRVVGRFLGQKSLIISVAAWGQTLT